MHVRLCGAVSQAIPSEAAAAKQQAAGDKARMRQERKAKARAFLQFNVLLSMLMKNSLQVCHACEGTATTQPPQLLGLIAYHSLIAFFECCLSYGTAQQSVCFGVRCLAGKG